MNDTTAPIDRSIAGWNETDADRRRALIEQTLTEDARYVDPLMGGDGWAGIDAMIARVQRKFSGFRFRRTGEIDAHNDVVRFGWELGPADGPALAGGLDVGAIADGRLRAIAGFLNFAPDAANG